MVNDASDFDHGAIDGFAWILFAGAYLILCLGTMFHALQPTLALRRS
jgi:hypothetical protein